MKKTKPKLAILALAVAMLSFAACSSVEVRPVGSVLTTKQSYLQGKRVAQETFSLADVIRYDVDLTWDDVSKSGGFHTVTWNWFKEGVLVSTDTKNLDFTHAPYGLYTMRAASALGLGKFRIDVSVDKKVDATVNFIIQ
jgi:hypothetical protein